MVYALCKISKMSKTNTIGPRKCYLRLSGEEDCGALWDKTKYKSWPIGKVTSVIHVGTICGSEDEVNEAIDVILNDARLLAKTNSLEWVADVLVRLRMPTIWKTDGIDDDIPIPNDSSLPLYTSAHGRCISFMNWMAHTLRRHDGPMPVRIFELSCPRENVEKMPTLLLETVPGCQVWEVKD